MKAKWQKGEFLGITEKSALHLNGTEAWVLIGRPFFAIGQQSDGSAWQGKSLVVNLETWNAQNPERYAIISPHMVELLARSPEDFAESVEMVPYEVWSSPDWKGV